MLPIAHLKEKITRVLRTYMIFISIGLSPEMRFKSVFACVLGAAGIGLQVGALSLALKYLSITVKHGTFSFLSQSYDLKTSVSALAAVAFVCFTLLILSSVATFYYYKMVMNLGAEAEYTIFQRLFSKLIKTPLLSIPTDEHKTDAAVVVRTLTADARTFGRAFHVGLLMIVPTFTFIGAVFSLLYLHPLTTISLLPFVLTLIYFAYRANQSSVDTAKDFEKLQSNFTKYVSALILDTSKTLLPHMNPRPPNENENLSDLSNPAKKYAELILIPHRSSLISDLFLAASASFVLFALSASAMLGHSSWTSIAAYLVSIRYGTNSLKVLLSRVSILSRFLPQLVRIRTMINASQKKSLALPDILELSSQKRPGIKLQLIKGKPIAVVSYEYLNRFQTARLLQRLVVNNSIDDLSRFLKPVFLKEFSGAARENTLLIFENLTQLRENLNISSDVFVFCRMDPNWPIEDFFEGVIAFVDREIIWLGSRSEFDLAKQELNLKPSEKDGFHSQDHDQDIDDDADFD